MDISRIDRIIQYALAVASGLDDYRQRELGPIHFIKYVYLADLAYAKAHAGQTYTGTPWRFHHFGPWAETVFERVPTALMAIGAREKVIPGQQSDFSRWSLARGDFDDVLDGAELLEGLERELGFVVALGIKSAVREYNSDTYRLLNDVYLSPPMLAAAPGETLDFCTMIRPITEHTLEPVASELTIKQLKKRAQKRELLKAEFSERLARKKAARAAAKSKATEQPPARYDDVFFGGLQVLDELGGASIQESKVTCTISDKIWKSKARHDPDLS